MHVAFVILHLGGNGAERVVYRLARSFSDRGHKVDIVLFRTIIHRSLPEGVRVFVLGDAPDRLTEERAAEQPGHPWFLDGGAPVLLAAG